MYSVHCTVYTLQFTHRDSTRCDVRCNNFQTEKFRKMKPKKEEEEEM